MTATFHRLARIAAAFAALAFLLGLAMAPLRAAELDFPALTGRVVDQANILPADVKADLTTRLQELEKANGDQLVVVTLSSLQGSDIATFGYQLGRKWGIGQAKLNNGALLIIAPSERKVRIEVGYGLEGTITDALSSVIIQRAILPRFKAGDIPGGVKAGVDEIIKLLQATPADREAETQRAADPPREKGGLPFGLFWGIVAIVVVIHLVGVFGMGRRQAATPALRRGRRSTWNSGSSSASDLATGAAIGSWMSSSSSSSSSSWSDSSSSSSSSDSFSGGGGSFGGGGASGDW